LRVRKFAETFPPLTDLWLVLTGLACAARGLVWFSVILLTVLYSGAVMITFWVSDEDTRIDVQEYFGTPWRSSITLLQITTLDNWASSIVRPLAKSNAFAAFFLVIFLIVSAYGLLSVAVGLLVCSTVQLARSHDGHGSNKSLNDDLTIIRHLREHYEMTLLIDDRSTIKLRDLRESMGLGQIRDAFKKLELPVKSTEELFVHLDKRCEGAITLQEFEKGLLGLKKPASRFDIACLTARIGGSVTYVARLESRTDKLNDELIELKTSIGKAIKTLHLFANAENRDPEVLLRRDGKIKPGPPPRKMRYTEG